MTVLFNLLAIVAVPGAIIFVTYSIFYIRKASNTSCNGELKQLRHLDGTIAKFHRVVKQHDKANGKMQHS